jgi:hypothetical protein
LLTTVRARFLSSVRVCPSSFVFLPVPPSNNQPFTYHTLGSSYSLPKLTALKGRCDQLGFWSLSILPSALSARHASGLAAHSRCRGDGLRLMADGPSRAADTAVAEVTAAAAQAKPALLGAKSNTPPPLSPPLSPPLPPPLPPRGPLPPWTQESGVNQEHRVNAAMEEVQRHKNLEYCDSIGMPALPGLGGQGRFLLVPIGWARQRQRRRGRVYPLYESVGRREGRRGVRAVL